MNTEYLAKDPEYQDKVRESFNRQDIMSTLGASLGGIFPGQVEISFPYAKILTQQHDFIHGGIVSTVLDSACGYAAFTLMPENAGILTIEFKVNLMAPAAGDYFVAIGKVKKPGRNITVSEGEMYAHTGKQRKLIATMTGTLMTIHGRDNIRY